MKTAIVGITVLLAASPAFAATSIMPRLAEVEDAVKNVAPVYRCEPGDKDSCQQRRVATNSKGEGFETSDYANGDHTRCFYPTPTYGLCHFILKSRGKEGNLAVILVNGQYTAIRPNDPRCANWGGFDTLEYLSCEAAEPPELEGAKPQ